MAANLNRDHKEKYEHTQLNRIRDRQTPMQSESENLLGWRLFQLQRSPRD